MTHTGWQTHHTLSRSANTVVLPTRAVILHVVFEMGIILIIDKTLSVKMTSVIRSSVTRAFLRKCKLKSVTDS